MKEIKLTKTMKFPQTEEERNAEKPLDKHERFLRELIQNNFQMIYLGDKVKVTNRITESKEKCYANKEGVVIGLTDIREVYNTIYEIQTEKGEQFETHYYSLDLIKQSEGNVLLEKILRESNSNFKRDSFLERLLKSLHFEMR